MVSLNSLNAQQIEAINSYDSNLLILAGAGTGKTLTITSRIANLILNNICYPENILAVTFTNKAAGEMKNRIENFIGSDANRIWVGTFHGISARILRMYHKALNLQQNFLIIDEYDRKKLITSIIKDLQIDEKRFPLKVCQFIISQLKEKCIDADDDERVSTFKYKDLDIAKLYRTYQMRLRGMNAVDFDDLIFECVQLFKKNPSILSDLQQRFKFITVDEYQDTNEIQHLWLCLLANGGANVCCVGDEDQSIYGWRGAKVDYILNFEHDFIGSKIIRLENNYRSTQEILNSAMSVISNNKQRYNKTLNSNISSNNQPYFVLVENDRQENDNIIKNIVSLKQNGENYKDIAILVRATYQMRGIEDAFIKKNIPYKIIGGIKFYDRKEIKDIIAYIRWCYSLTDLISLERIINVPKRNIGEKTFSEIINYIRNNNIEIAEGLNNIVNYSNILKGSALASLRQFLDFTFNIHNLFFEKDINLTDIFEKIYFNSGYSEMLQEELKTDQEVVSRIENIRELITSAKQFNNIDEFLEHISLVSASDDENNEDNVNIMTMHAAKGLEFLYVFLPAWDEGIFPSQKSIDENGGLGLEEERRLAYVALTRARKNFYVYSAKQRFQFGKLQICQPSKFIFEMQHTLNKIDLTYHSANKNIYHSNNKLPVNNSSYYSGKKYQYSSYNRVDNYSNSEKYSNEFSSYADDNISNAYQALKKGVVKRKNGNYMPSVEEQIQKKSFYDEEEANNSLNVGDKVYNEKFGFGIIKRKYGKFYDVRFDNGKTQILKDITKVK